MYKHKIVQVLAALYDEHKDTMIESIGKEASKDFTMKAIWMGVKRQAPAFIQSKIEGALQLLDNNDEAVVDIEAKLREMLDIKESTVAVVEAEPRIAKSPKKKIKLSKVLTREEHIAEAKVTLEPLEEE